MNNNTKVLLLISFLSIFSTIVVADTIISILDKSYDVEILKVDDDEICFYQPGVDGIKILQINNIKSAFLWDGTVLIKNRVLVQKYNESFVSRKIRNTVQESAINTVQESAIKEFSFNYQMIGYGCIGLSGVMGLVNNNREYGGNSHGDLENFQDWTKKIANFQYGLLVVGVLFLSKNNKEVPKDIPEN